MPTLAVKTCAKRSGSQPKRERTSKRVQVREAEISKVPFLAALVGCSARRSERRVASHTSEEQRRNAPASAVKNGIFAISASLSRRYPRSALSVRSGS